MDEFKLPFAEEEENSLQVKIIKELWKDSRISLQDISDKLNTPKSTIQSNFATMIHKKQLIKRFTIEPNYEKLGFAVQAFILVTAKGDQRRIKKQIEAIQGVIDVHIITGEWDMLIHVVDHTMKHMGDMILDKLRAIDGIEKTYTLVKLG